MKNKKAYLCGALAGLLLGVLLVSAVYDMGGKEACPRTDCLKDSEVIPVSDRGYFDALHNELAKARSYVHIVCFEMKHYPSYGNASKQNVIVEDLIAAKKRGVDVKILVDEYAGDSGYEYLKKMGVDIRFDSNKTTTHSKVVIIDGRVVLIGSTNFSYFSLEKNNEANVLLRSAKAAAYFEEYFKALWEKEKNKE